MPKEFIKYQHIERFGTTEVENIEDGRVFVFPKIDGTNASVWLSDGVLCVASRKRVLSIGDDNAGFCAWINKQQNVIDYLSESPEHRLFGEWLCPHSLKTYREDAWRNFYVFDVAVDKEKITHEGDHWLKYLPYDDYKDGLEKHGISYIPPICVIENTNYDQLVKQLDKNVFLIENGKGIGEGIVIKNYDFRNKYGRQTWAKIITSEFKEKHSKTMGPPELKGQLLIENKIVDKYVTTALCEKVKANIESDNGCFLSKDIPRLLNTVYYELVKEESWNFVKEFKNPIIEYKILQRLTYNKVKECFPTLF